MSLVFLKMFTLLISEIIRIHIQIFLDAAVIKEEQKYPVIMLFNIE